MSKILATDDVELARHERGYLYATATWENTVFSEPLPMDIEEWPEEEWKELISDVAARLKARVRAAQLETLKPYEVQKIHLADKKRARKRARARQAK